MAKYTLIKKPESERNKVVVTIVADSNDADYITTINTYNKKLFDEEIFDLLYELKYQYSGPHKLENYIGKLEVPRYEFGDYGNCHTIKTIKVEYIDNSGEVWEVSF